MLVFLSPNQRAFPSSFKGIAASFHSEGKMGQKSKETKIEVKKIQKIKMVKQSTKQIIIQVGLPDLK